MGVAHLPRFRVAQQGLAFAWRGGEMVLLYRLYKARSGLRICLFLQGVRSKLKRFEASEQRKRLSEENRLATRATRGRKAALRGNART